MFQAELETALTAARLASAHLVAEYERFQVIADAPANITTDADRQSQEIILQAIRRAFPGDALCAEEATETLQGGSQTGERLWIVDPIDGTRGFARKNGEFSVMIAFAHENQIAVGVVAQPAVRKLTYAVRGQGCWRLDGADATPTRCHATAVADTRKCTLTQSRSRDPNKRSLWVDAIEPASIVESYSAGIKLALVARGDADVYLNTYEAFHDWDIAAGHILVSEAGGTVTGTGGQALEYGLEGAWQKNGLLATNGHLHDATLKIIASCGKG
ncbi:MAG: 3'(2'),5'-bisphosphate nucleotidase CysQ [Planctomycetes bacterium]|jgi:3'(2'), 5'-bisphosphate nucleotidase|nr:3'(2'),5'-bisphosphate nucleotidase CysQ [Planctomycetota bacterium]